MSALKPPRRFSTRDQLLRICVTDVEELRWLEDRLGERPHVSRMLLELLRQVDDRIFDGMRSRVCHISRFCESDQFAVKRNGSRIEVVAGDGKSPEASVLDDTEEEPN